MRTFWPLDDFEIYTISLFQRSVAVTRNVGVMDENVRTVISPDKAVAPGIYEPLHLALHLHTCCSQRYARAASKASADWRFLQFRHMEWQKRTGDLAGRAKGLISEKLIRGGREGRGPDLTSHEGERLARQKKSVAFA